ncbi:TRAFs-binding domain-containing protein [uncultured Albimonas sp.]|uniref:TRAFs-binding domain-containing protein n=1 Tax=uncultured Albimonas sp. TaxID=1331701 RepID=UPI0030ED24B6|tara:strand:+ start:430 stop:1845 length:1416 start_codon:yes stop_codon:yes gene_type:complete
MDDPLCFILMPFGEKPDPIRNFRVDFDAVYEIALKPGIERAGMVPLRGDLEAAGGIIHKQFFERLIFCDFAVADLTTSNPNVYYELGVRHAVRPHTTVAVTAHPDHMPFDVSPLRAIAYMLDDEGRLDSGRVDAFIASLAAALTAARSQADDAHGRSDSPLFQLVNGYRAPDIAHLRADLFPERARSEQAVSARIAAIRSGADFRNVASVAAAVEALDAVRRELGAAAGGEATPALELMLAYRALKAWDRIVAVFDDLPEPLRRQALPREQTAMALNRLAERAKDRAKAHALAARALELLNALEAERGANAETCGLIGRVHKNLWRAATAEGFPIVAEGQLDLAIQAYRRGFEADSRDYYPGINLATLLSVRAAPEDMAELGRLVPVVRWATEKNRREDYWKHATLLELAVLARDPAEARRRLVGAATRVTEGFQPGTTADNLEIIVDTAADPEAVAFARDLVSELRRLSP